MVNEEIIYTERTRYIILEQPQTAQRKIEGKDLKIIRNRVHYIHQLGHSFFYFVFKFLFTYSNN